nr:hypothetical protein CFP56_09842 [Quercus suber]
MPSPDAALPSQYIRKSIRDRRRRRSRGLNPRSDFDEHVTVELLWRNARAVRYSEIPGSFPWRSNHKYIISNEEVELPDAHCQMPTTALSIKAHSSTSAMSSVNPTTKKPEPTVSDVPAQPLSGAMASGQSSWNTSGFAFSPNTNVQDRQSMPSNEAEAARRKADDVMAALRSGKPGAADQLMGEQKEGGGKGIVPLQWLQRKLRGEKRDNGEQGENGRVVR